MHDRRKRTGILASLAVPIPVLVIVAVVLAATSGRTDLRNAADAVGRARDGHGCDDSACSICSAERAWLARNPGRTSTDLADLAEFGPTPGSRIRVVPRVEDGVYE